MTIYGYARVSTKGQSKYGTSLEEQVKQLKAKGCEVIFQESYTGTTKERPEFSKLLETVKENDQIIVTKLDRFARSALDAIQIIKELFEKGVVVYILNMGLVEDTPMGRVILTVMGAFAEFERDMIVERTQTGKAIAKENNPEFTEGRPQKLSDEVLDEALVYLESHTYEEAVNKYKVSKSTLIRHKRRRKAESLDN